MTEKVAIFLDVENLSSWLKADGGETLLERANELGRVVVRRAYGDFSIKSVSVRQAELNLLGFEFVHVYHPVKGKNSADIQIVVDVMGYLALIPDLEWVILATGDSDFSPLFRRLRELGKSVVGVGLRSALSEAVKKSCNRFIYIDEDSTSDSKSDLLKTTQLREEALDLLERTLDKFPDGAILSTIDLYKRLLSKKGWQSRDPLFLWEILGKLKSKFLAGCTRSEQFEYLIEEFGRNRTRKELRSAMYILHKIGCVEQQQQRDSNDEPILITNLPESERRLSKKLDAILLSSLVQICKSNGIFFNPELVPSLLINSYTEGQLQALIANAQTC